MLSADATATLGKARGLAWVQARLGGGHNRNSAKRILAEVQREHGRQAADRLMAEYDPQRVFGFEPDTDIGR